MVKNKKIYPDHEHEHATTCDGDGIPYCHINHEAPHCVDACTHVIFA